ncbi:MFS transporter [Amycolatopsis sp. TRM77291]
MSIAVIVVCRLALGESSFAAWGWRIPFLLSAVLVLFSLMVRLKIHESPVFERMRSTGTLSRSPIKDTLAVPSALRLVATVLFGVTAGLGVAWYTSQFYSLYFLQTAMKMDFLAANLCVGVALVIGTPFFVLFGRLSDTLGRLRFIVAGLLLSAVSYVPLFAWMRDGASEGRFIQVSAAVTIQVLFVTMVYGPTAAYLAELFPPQIRYTGISVAYQLGTGVFGGLTPLIALSMTGGASSLDGLTYPIVVTAVSALVALILLRKGAHGAVSLRAWEAADRRAPESPASSITEAPVADRPAT